MGEFLIRGKLFQNTNAVWIARVRCLEWREGGLPGWSLRIMIQLRTSTTEAENLRKVASNMVTSSRLVSNVYVDPKSMHNNGPKPLETAQKAMILHTFWVQVGAHRKSLGHELRNPVSGNPPIYGHSHSSTYFWGPGTM